MIAGKETGPVEMAVAVLYIVLLLLAALLIRDLDGPKEDEDE